MSGRGGLVSGTGGLASGFGVPATQTLSVLQVPALHGEPPGHAPLTASTYTGPPLPPQLICWTQSFVDWQDLPEAQPVLLLQSSGLQWGPP